MYKIGQMIVKYLLTTHKFLHTKCVTLWSLTFVSITFKNSVTTQKMQPSLSYEGQTLNTDSEHNHHLISEPYKAHITFCGENATVFNVKTVGTYSTVCTLKGFNPVFPDFNTLCKIL